MSTARHFGGQPPRAFDGTDDQGIKLALMALSVFTGGRVIMVVGADEQGAVWFIPAPNVPLDVLKDTLQIDWSYQVRQLEEWLT